MNPIISPVVMQSNIHIRMAADTLILNMGLSLQDDSVKNFAETSLIRKHLPSQPA